ncbi:MAG: PspC domain-containing protein [Bacilli bacterium]|nr:PspC domain-containing protein [Bacilli bacterium]
MPKRLYKIEEGKKLCGVCGGIAEYFNLDPTIVRLLWVLLVFCAGTGVLAYIVAALIMPDKNEIIKK